MSLHDDLKAIVLARQERAQAATPGPWTAEKAYRRVLDCRCLSCYEDWPGAWQVPELDGPPGADTSPTVYAHDAQFIAAENPAFVLTQCARDLKVLERHSDHGGRCTECMEWCECQEGTYVDDCACRGNRPHPCPEIKDMADVYGILTEEATDHVS